MTQGDDGWEVDQGQRGAGSRQQVTGRRRRLVVGCGYLGERVARLWREAGDEVYATTRGHRVDTLARAGLHPVRLDVISTKTADPLPEVDTVVFAVGRDRRADTSMMDLHAGGLRAVLDALPTSSGPVIYVSSTGVYGQHDGEWVDERSVCEPTSSGGIACLAAERLLAAHPRGRNAIVLRLAGLYGRGRVPHLAAVRSGALIRGSADAYLNLIHVEDAAAAVVAPGAIGPTGGSTYVVSDGHPPTRGTYLRWLAARLGVATPPFSGVGGLGKRVRNRRAVTELRLQLKHPSYRHGLATMARGPQT